MEHSSFTQMVGLGNFSQEQLFQSNQMETGTEEVVTKEVNDRYSTVANVGDPSMQSDNGKISKVKEEISTTKTETTECQKDIYMVKNIASGDTESDRDRLGTVPLTDMPLPRFLCQRSTTEKKEELKTNEFMDDAPVSMPVSHLSSKVAVVSASSVHSTSSLKFENKAKRLDTIVSNLIKMKNNGSAMRIESTRTVTTAFAETGVIEHSIRESGSQDRDDGYAMMCMIADGDENNTGAPTAMPVSLATGTVRDIPGSTFISTSLLKAGNKAKRPATIESSPVQAKSVSSPSPDTGRNKHSIWESGSGDHNDGCNNTDGDENKTGSSRQHHVDANPNDAEDDCDEAQFPCLDCAAVFETNAAFKVHIASHAEHRRYQCTLCEKRFTRRENLMVHMRRHTGERPFDCDVCEKKFTTFGDLIRHKRVHTGEKPFKCDVCGKCFTQSDHLKSHNRVHTAERPFKCDNCDKGCLTDGELKRHKHVHSGEKYYICMTCGECFTRNDSLQRHKRTQHADTDAEAQLDDSHIQDLRSTSPQAYASNETSPMEDSIITEKI